MNIGLDFVLQIVTWVFLFALYAWIIWLVIQIFTGGGLTLQAPAWCEGDWLGSRWWTCSRSGEGGGGMKDGGDLPFTKEDEQAIDKAHETLNKNLMTLRQVVAQAIATEKLLEQQLESNLDQAERWQERVTAAESQGNEELAAICLSRRSQYVFAIEELSKQLEFQKRESASLRRQLTELEVEVWRVFTRKEVLQARMAAAEAKLSIHEGIAELNAAGAFDSLKAVERHVENLEVQAAFAAASPEAKKQILDILLKTSVFVEEAMASIEAVYEADRGKENSADEEHHE